MFLERKVTSKKVDIKNQLKVKEFKLHELDFIIKVKAQQTTHLTYLKFVMNSGKKFFVGTPNIVGAKNFKLSVYKTERPFSTFGTLAPVGGFSNKYALVRFGVDTRILSEEDKILEKQRGKAALFI